MNYALRLAMTLMLGSLSAADTLTLPQLQQTMLEHNHRLAIARRETEAAEAKLDQARAAWHPKLGLSGRYLYQSEKQSIELALPPPMGSIERNIGDHDRTEIGADLSWPLFTGLGRLYGTRGSRLATEASALNAQELQNRLSLELGMLYFRYELARKTACGRGEQVELLQEHLGHVKDLYDAGIVIRAAVAGAEAGLAGAQVQLHAARNTRDSLKAAMFLVAGVKGRESFCKEYPLDFDSAAVRSLLADTAREHRPAIAALDSTVEQLTMARKALNAGHLPTIAAVAGYRYADPGPALGGEGFTGYAIAGINLSWTLYDGFATRAQKNEVSSRQDIVKQQREHLLREFAHRIERARQGLTVSRQQLAAARLGVDAAQRQVEDTRNALDAGTATSMEYLDALQELSDARLRRDRAVFSCKAHYLQLGFALGTELQFQQTENNQ